MNVTMEPLSEIETALKNFDFIETSNPQVPVMGRIIVGTIKDEQSEKWKMIVLEIGLESAGDEYEWYWEISIKDDSTTENISKNHNTGFKTQYKPSCKACSIIPLKFDGSTLKDFSGLIIEDITRNFKDN